MAVNDPRVIDPEGNIRQFQMGNTWNIGQSESRQHIINWVAQVARNSQGGKLKNLVLSCHGLPGYLQLGQGFNSSNMDMFIQWRGLIEKIWLPNCLVARTPDAAMSAQMAQSYPGFGVSDGNIFCSSLAKKVQCYVVASTEIQLEYFRVLPIDMMTSFEGLVLSYGPQGNVTWRHSNPSTYVPD